MSSTIAFSDEVERARAALADADYVLVGAGAGLSAAGGIDYLDPELFQRWHPRLAARGMRAIAEAISNYWYLTDENRTEFWAFWAAHIDHIRYRSPATAPYLDLRAVLDDERTFIISTNVDGQFEKAGFARAMIFAPQGDYGLFQCSRPCSQDVYDNRCAVEEMVAATDPVTGRIPEDLVPHCPGCGARLVQNLRADSTFVERPHMLQADAYEEFLERAEGHSLVLLELGVGFNTPGIIRWPFDRLARFRPDTTLIRINAGNADVPDGPDGRHIGIRADLAVVLHALAGGRDPSR